LLLSSSAKHGAGGAPGSGSAVAPVLVGDLLGDPMGAIGLAIGFMATSRISAAYGSAWQRQDWQRQG
jgi:hypothetical protein